MIWSIFFHAVLIIGIIQMSPPTAVAMRVVEVCLIESPVARSSDRSRLTHHHTGTDVDRRNVETHRPQPVHKGGRTSSLLVTHNGTGVPPSDEAPVSAAQKSTQIVPPESVVLNSAPTNPLTTRSREERPEGNPSLPFRQNPGIGQAMTLGEVGSPRFIHRELPAYPFMARRLGKEGKVVLRLVLDAEGWLQSVETVDANGFGFAEAAISAIRKSTFAPAVRNGRAVSSQVLVPVRFVLNESPS